MDQPELAGAPLTWLCLFLATLVVAAPGLVLGLLRRGSGEVYESSFVVQRLPQLVIGLVFPIVMLGFEAIELKLGNGEPAFGGTLFESFPGLLPFITLAVVLPGWLAAALSWAGVLWSLLGVLLFVGGIYALGASFSTDAELLEGQELQSRGPYRFVMHPIYAGYVHFLLGTALTNLSPLGALVVAALVYPLLRRRAEYEESLLLSRYGAAYESFAEARRWHRFVPLVPPVS